MTSFRALIPSAPRGRFDGIQRPYTPGDVERLRGSVVPAQTLAEHGSNRLWEMLHKEDYVHALGALSGNQAMQMVRAGLRAIYLSGWQVAADANAAGAMYPDQRQSHFAQPTCGNGVPLARSPYQMQLGMASSWSRRTFGWRLSALLDRHERQILGPDVVCRRTDDLIVLALLDHMRGPA
jgi:hypothetical protein